MDFEFQNYIMLLKIAILRWLSIYYQGKILLLILRIFDLKEKKNYEYAPLHFAIEKNDIDIVKLLLSMISIPKINNIQTSFFLCPDDVDRGFTALHLAWLNIKFNQ